MRNIRGLFYILLFQMAVLFYPSHLYAQLTVVQGSEMNMTPYELVQNHLIGAGITISNVTYNGATTLITSNQVGTFTTAGTATTELNLEAGVLMTSGKASNAIGPNNKANAGSNANGPGDPDLNIISGSTTHDKAVIEFDFIPQYDTVRFRYVFGSEEFFEYCSGFNDAFGFFLSGPGISGGFSNNSVNIALMPGSSSMYVTINNICNNPMSRWENDGGVNYQYDGLTHVFTAWHVVVPCSTYHIKLAVADASDYSYDSGVFLEENSFSSPGVAMNTTGTIPSLGSNAYEGCNDVAVNFHLEAPMNYAYTVNFIISGNAINGTDYTLIPDKVTFPAGTDSLTLIIHPILDMTPEGNESVIITVDQINCNGTVNSDTIIISDYLPMTVAPNRDTTVCHGAEVELMAVAQQGIRPYHYTWNMTPANDSVVTFIPPVGTKPYHVKVSDVCNNAVYDTAIIIVHPKPVAHAGETVTIPNGTSTTLQGSVDGGYGSYEYSWTSNPPGFTSDLPNPNTGNLFSSMIYHLVGVDITSGCASEPSQVMVIVEGGLLSANPAVQPTSVCLGSEAQLYALAGGGSGIYTYSWSSDPPGFSSTESTPFVIPLETTAYSVVVHDGFNQVEGNTTLTVNPLPYIHLGPADSIVCVYDTILLDAGNPGSTYRWSNGSKSRSIVIGGTGIGFEAQSYQVTVTNPNGCVDSANITVIFTFSACTGIQEGGNILDFNLFPNPTTGLMSLTLISPAELFTIDIYNIYGVKVMTIPIDADTGKLEKKDLDISTLPSGLYLVIIKSDVATGLRKVLLRK